MKWYEVAFGELYPLVYSHRDDEEAARAARRIAPLLAGRGPVLDIACGAGRYMAAFEAAGLDVFGLDLSAFLLIEAVERRGLGGRVVLGDMRRLPVRDRCLGAATNMFTSFGYFDDDADNRRVLKEAARVLRPRGRFVLDYLNPGTLEADTARETVREVGDAVVREKRRLDTREHIIEKHVKVTVPGRPDVEFSERVRVYTARELTEMAGGVGLTRAEMFGDYGLGGYEPTTSPRMILLFERAEGAR